MTNKTFRLNAWVAAIAALGSMGFTTVQAQGSSDSPPPSATDKRGSDGIEEVIVTAQFKEERLQDTPISITAMSASMLEARSQTDITQVATAAPNVTLTQASAGFGNSATASIRGVGQYDFNFAMEPGVGMYVDDVYHATLFGSVFDLLDLDRVEVLRGPQGTLAGKNSIGGAIKLFSKKPDGSGGGYIEGTYGDFNRVDLRASGNFTLVEDKLFARLSGVSKQRDGHVTRYDYACKNPGATLPDGTPFPTFTTSTDCVLGTEGGQDFHALRAAVRWLASESVEVNVIADATEDNSEAAASTPIVLNNPFTTIAGQNVPLDASFIPSSFYANYSTYQNPNTGLTLPAVNTVSGSGISGTVDWTLSDHLSLKSISAYRQYKGDFSQDLDASPMSVETIINKVSARQVSQELRLSGLSFNEFLDWTVGGYYFKGDNHIAGRKDITAFGLDFMDDDPIDSKSKSVFGHTVWHLTDALNATAGVRYTKEEKTYTFTRLNPDGTEPLPPDFAHGVFPQNWQLFGLSGLSGEYSGNQTDYRLGVDYRWTPDLMTYAQYSTGFKGGGVNPRPFFGTQVLSFDPETLNAAEVGFKSDWFDKKARVNVSAFFNKYKDIQLTLLSCDFASPFPGAPCALPANAGDADVKGLELETELHPMAGLTIDGSLSWLDFKYTRIDPSTGVGDGDISPYTPKRKASLGIQYNIPFANGSSLTPRVDGAYQSSFYTSAVNAPTNAVDSRTLLNARLTWASAGGDWQTSLAVTNLTDKEYYATTFDLTGSMGVETGQPGRPREWAVTVKRNF